MSPKYKPIKTQSQQNLWQEFALIFISIIPLIAGFISIINDAVGFVQLIQDTPDLLIICSIIVIWLYCIYISLSAKPPANPNPSNIWAKVANIFVVLLPFILFVLLGVSRLTDGNTGFTTRIFFIIGFAGLWIASYYGSSRNLQYSYQVSKKILQITKIIAKASLFVVPASLIWLLWLCSRPVTDKILLVAEFSSEAPIVGNIRINETLTELLETEFEDETNIQVKYLSYPLETKSQAISISKDYKASVVIWGSYIEKPNNSALIYLNFETPCLRCSNQFLENWQKKPKNIKDIEGFDFEVSLSDELANLSLFTFGLVQYQDDDWMGSIETFSNILNNSAFSSLSPEFQSIIYFYRGISLEQTEQSDKAINDFNIAVNIDPKNGVAHMWLGSMLYENGNYLEAIDHYNTAIIQNVIESCKYIYTNRGNAYLMAEKYDLAFDDYQKTIQLLPEYDLAYYQIGLAEYYRTNYSSAISYYDKAIELTSDRPLAYYFAGRGDTYLAIKDYEKAIDNYDRATAIDDSSPIVFNNLANAYFMLGDHETSTYYYGKAIALEPNNAIYFNERGNVYYDWGKHDQALKDFEEAIKRDPSFSNPHLGKGNVYFNQKKLHNRIY